jgi:hypothetical protein
MAMIKIFVNGKDGRKAEYRFENYVDTCPFCRKGIVPEILSSYINKQIEEIDYLTISWVIFRCPRNECGKIFIGVYGYINEKGGYFKGPVGVYPVFPSDKTFTKIINDISLDFVKIYNQAYSAEQHNLDLIVGPGYRKALEYLIKDYAIFISDKTEEENIQRMFLGQVIDTYIEDKRIKNTAKRAAWLGNDETHYFRKWEEEDLESLKLMILLTIRWIESVELTKKSIEDMPET